MLLPCQYVTTTYTFTYDSQSRPIKKREQNNKGLDRVEAYEYNENGLLLKLTKLNIKSNLKSVTTYFYNESNYLIKTETKGKSNSFKIEDHTTFINDNKGNWLTKKIFRDNELKYYFERIISYKLKNEE